MQVSKSECVIEYAPLVKRIASRMAFKYGSLVEYEDLVQVGMIGLLDAYDKYVVTKDCSFRTYAGKRIVGSIMDELRKLDHLSRPDRQAVKNGGRLDVDICYLEDYLCGSEDNIADDRDNPLDVLIRKDMLSKALSRIDSMTGQVKKVMQMHYHEGMSLKDISLELGVTISAVSQSRTRAIAILKLKLA